MHEQRNMDKNYNFIISGKPKGWTFRFETYAVMQAVSGERLPTVAVVRVADDTTKIEFVRKLLSESRKAGLKKVNNSHEPRV